MEAYASVAGTGPSGLYRPSISSLRLAKPGSVASPCRNLTNALETEDHLPRLPALAVARPDHAWDRPQRAPAQVPPLQRQLPLRLPSTPSGTYPCRARGHGAGEQPATRQRCGRIYRGFLISMLTRSSTCSKSRPSWLSGRRSPHNPPLVIPSVRPLPPPELADALRHPEHFRRAAEVEQWIGATFLAAESPLHNPEHEHLRFARIGVLWTNVAAKRGGLPIVGTAEIPRPKGGPWIKARQVFQLEEWFGAVPDFLITLDAPYAAEADDASWCALIEHELYPLRPGDRRVRRSEVPQGRHPEVHPPRPRCRGVRRRGAALRRRPRRRGNGRAGHGRAATARGRVGADLRRVRDLPPGGRYAGSAFRRGRVSLTGV